MKCPENVMQIQRFDTRSHFPIECPSHMYFASDAASSRARASAVATNFVMSGKLRHGMTGTPEWCAWQSMKARCSIPSASHFAEYGGRGIRVCERWMTSFEAFFADVGARPSPLHSLDRIDVNGDYAPGNVRWATREEQHRNKRNTRMLEIDGERLCLSDWVKRSPVSIAAIIRRLDAGWSTRDAVFAPSQNVGDRSLRRVANYAPWICVACSSEIVGRKRANSGRCPACRLPRRRK